MLWKAAESGDIERCKKAIDDGADINCRCVSIVYFLTGYEQVSGVRGKEIILIQAYDKRPYAPRKQ